MGATIKFLVFQVLIIVYCVVQVKAGVNPHKDGKVPRHPAKSKIKSHNFEDTIHKALASNENPMIHGENPKNDGKMPRHPKNEAEGHHDVEDTFHHAMSVPHDEDNEKPMQKPKKSRPKKKQSSGKNKSGAGGRGSAGGRVGAGGRGGAGGKGSQQLRRPVAPTGPVHFPAFQKHPPRFLTVGQRNSRPRMRQPHSPYPGRPYELAPPPPIYPPPVVPPVPYQPYYPSGSQNYPPFPFSAPFPFQQQVNGFPMFASHEDYPPITQPSMFAVHEDIY